MALRIYNTMSRDKEEFEPLTPGRVNMYVCGVTVYDQCHIGHARSQVVFDTVVRYFRHLGYDVHYARNFTDIDDKIINRANERKMNWKDVAEENIALFYRDMDSLGIARPTVEPKATDHIPQIIDTIRELVSNGYAYAKGGDVFFSTRKFADYGKLSKRNLDDMIAGERVEVDERKKDPLDFVLWKAAKPGEPTWESPWGAGRPGWHIECSAMSRHHLGMPFDIHGGGRDLIFPHHENEIAQSEGAFRGQFARMWMHNGFVQLNHEKMAKSTGNFFTLAEVLKKYPPEALRFFLLSAHYRSPIDFSEQSIQEAQAAVERMYTAWESLDKEAFSSSELDESKLNEKQKELLQGARKSVEEFHEAMDDDFNTAKATGHMFEVAHAINAMTEKEYRAEPGRSMLLTMISKHFGDMRGILGFLINEPKDYQRAKNNRQLLAMNLTEAEIEDLIQKRAEARKARNFAEGDRIRDELAAKGVVLKDTPQGTTWSVK
jgi:cysteinyl-tRNA synthetase